MAENYILRVTAGTDYDLKTHHLVPVNSSSPTTLSSDLVDVELNVRILGFSGLPLHSPSTSPYFELPIHKKNKDTYSIGFRLNPKEDINGDDLVWGNDFDHPIRERLPIGSGMMLKGLKMLVDPGLEGDVYADQPYLYGPLGSSINLLSIETGSGKNDDGELGIMVEEGGDSEGVKMREESGIPDDVAGRKKWFLRDENRKEWKWKGGVWYGCDFFNGMLDFNRRLPVSPSSSTMSYLGMYIDGYATEFAIRIPSPTKAISDYYVPIMKYWDGQPARYAYFLSHNLHLLDNSPTLCPCLFSPLLPHLVFFHT